MNLKSCECGVVLDLDSKLLLHKIEKDNSPTEYYYECPVCNRNIEVS